MKRQKILTKSVAAALQLAETEKWGSLTLAEIADEAGLSLKDVHGQVDKEAISAAVETGWDAAMSEGSLDPDETARTRLFDVIMLRFEAMEEVRDGAMSYLRWRDRTLDGLQLRVSARLASAKWALVCAGLDRTQSLPRGVQITALAWAMTQAERAWREETSPDLSRTMAALDAELIKIEERLEWVGRLSGSRRSATEDDTA